MTRPLALICTFLGEPEQLHFWVHDPTHGQGDYPGDYAGWTTSKKHATRLTWAAALDASQVMSGSFARLEIPETQEG